MADLFDNNARSNQAEQVICRNSPESCSRESHTCFELESIGSLDRDDEAKPSWRSLFTFMRRQNLLTLILALSATIIAGLVRPVSAVLLGNVFTSLTRYGAGEENGLNTLHNVSDWSIAFTVLGVIAWLLEGLFLSAWMAFGEQQAASVREQMFAGMLEKDIEWYDMRRDGVGSLMNRIQTQVRELQLAVSQPLGFLIFETIGSLAAIGTAFYYSWKLTLVIVATFPFAAVILSFLSRNLPSAIEAQKRELSLASRYVNSAIKDIHIVKAYNGQDEEVWQYYSTIKRAAVYYLLQAKSNALQFGFMKLVMVGVFVQGFWYGTVLVRQGMITGHVLTTFYACLNALQAVEVLLPQWLVLTKGMSAGETLKRIMAQVQRGRKVVSMGGSLKPDACEGDIEINNVTFAYPSNPTQHILKGATLFFPAGETTFVVGRSGSGKSTIGNLLVQFYAPLTGGIFLDGQALQTIDKTWLRQRVTLLLQQSVLFNATLGQNVSFGANGTIIDCDIERACQIMDLDTLIKELPDGLETMVGSKYRDLSGGQTQRVSLARAYLRNTPILILDEATSALDPSSRAKFIEKMRLWREGKTTIIITHDVSCIQDDDYVYVLEDGFLVQEGYRGKLMEKKDGQFASFSEVPPESAAEYRSNPIEQFQETVENPSPQHPGIFSKFFRLGTPETKHSPMMMQIQAHRRMSLGVASAQANAIRADTLWRSPIVPEVSEMTEIQRRRKFSKHLLSIDTSNASFPEFRKRRSTPFLPSQISPGTGKARKFSTPTLSPIDLHGPEKGQRQLSDPFGPHNVVSSDSSLVSLSSDSRKDNRGSKALKPLSKASILNHAASVTERHASLSKAASSWPGSFDIALERDHSRASKDERKQDNTHVSTDKGEDLTSEGPLVPATLSKIFSTVWSTLAWQDRGVMLVGFLAAFVVAAATPAFAFVFAQLAKTFYVMEHQQSEARNWALSMLGIAIVDGLASYCSHYALEYSGQVWVNALRIEALKRILRQPKTWFDQKENTPERITEYLDRNAEEMRNLIGRFLGIAFTIFWMLGISVVWALAVSWKLTLVSLVGVPAVYLITRIFNVMSTTWEDRCNTAAETVSSIFTETFYNIRVVRTLTLEGHFSSTHTDATKETYKTGLKRAAFSGLIFGLTDSTSFFVCALIFYYSAVVVTNGELSVERAIQVINLMLFGIANSTGMISMIPQIVSAKTTATQVLKLAELPLRRTYESRGTERLASLFPIEFNHLNFTYSNQGSQTLSNLDLVFPTSSCTAIVGSSGSGKSTIASLILGLYLPDIPILRGRPTLTFSGTSITDCNLASLRGHSALVSQTPTLFPATILSNILYGLSETSPYNNLSSAISGATDAGIHDFICSLPNGYDTLIGDGGQGISGGQAQRISIARALVRQPKLLILDEATSALDSEAVNIIRETIQTFLHCHDREAKSGDKNSVDRTSHARGSERAVLIITHNVEMMKLAERIVVLEKGSIVEEGSWQDLRRRQGAFVKLLGKQCDNDGRGQIVMTSPTKNREHAHLPSPQLGLETTTAAAAAGRYPVSPVVGRTRDSWVRRGSAI